MKWFRPTYVAWWWRNAAGPSSKAGVMLVGIALIALAGFVLAERMSAATTEETLHETTVQQIVTVREKGKIVRRPVQVVRRVRVVTTKGSDGTTVVERQVVSAVPRVVTRDGEVVTQTRTVVPRRRTVTNNRTVTDQRVVTTDRVVTAVQTATDVRTTTVTRTVTQTATERATVTVSVPVTVTVPGTVTGTAP
jgi:hypothetical protein